MRMSLQKVKGPGEKGNCVLCASRMQCRRSGKYSGPPTKQQLETTACLFGLANAVGFLFHKVSGGCETFSIKLNSVMSVADEIRVGVDF